MTVFTLKLLWTVSPHFRQSGVVLALAAAFGVWSVSVVPGDIGAPYALLLFCQLFAASSGFRPAANAGYYDLALVRGASRRELALCHWLLSSGPGWLAWLLVSGVETCFLGTGVAVGGATTSVVGLLVVSTITWVTTLPTSRFIGGAGWLLVMGLVASWSGGRSWVNRVIDGSAPAGVFEVASDFLTLVTVPVLFLVPMAGAAAGHPAILLAATALSLVALGCGVRWVVVRDFPGGG